MLPKAVLFDLDDTILDDSGCVERSWTDACEECCPKDQISRLREAIRVAADWFWADPDRHRIGRLDMKTARRQVAALNREDNFRAAERIGEMIYRRQAYCSLTTS